VSKVYVISDTHFGHKNITKYRPQFKTAEEHDAVLLQNIKNVVSKRDILIMLGDIAFNTEALMKLKSIECRKQLILGNHDMQFSRVDILKLYEVFTRVDALRSYKGVWLSHAPIHPDELRGKKNVHGHTHFNSIEDPRYFNACVEQLDYKPKLFTEIKEIFDETNLH